MNNTIYYKINDAYMLPYESAINEDLMGLLEKSNEIIASSRIYLVCRLSKNIFSSKLSKPEVLYVGESFDKEHRFSGHKHILKATTLLNKGFNPLKREFLAVYFLHIRFSFTGFKVFQNNPWDVFQELKDIGSKSSVELLERLYIKIFNPVLNIKHKNEKIKDDPLILKKLIDNDVEYVHLDIGMDDNHFQFYTSSTSTSCDWYNYDLKTERIIPGYLDTFPDDIRNAGNRC